MNFRTDKNDWLNSALAVKEDILVSGDPTFATRIGLPEEAIPSLRWIGNRKTNYQLLFTVEAEVKLWQIVQDVLRTSQIALALSKIIPDQITTTLLFSNEFTKPGILPPTGETFDELNFFWVSTNGIDFIDVDSFGLTKIFCKLNAAFTTDPGAKKERNKTQNDGFQLWTAKNISGYVLVSDIDALNLKTKNLFELKRVKEKIETWEPYRDEESQYVAFKEISFEAGHKFQLLAYQPSRLQLYSQHKLKDIFRDKITGWKRIMHQTEGVQSEWVYYESLRQRKQNRGY